MDSNLIPAERTEVSAVGQMTVNGLVAQVTLIREAMKTVMAEGEHYGIIPGCKKPTLLKAGAEKLCMLFRLAPNFELSERWFKNGHYQCSVKCKLTHIPTDQVWGQGYGSCSTMESKYRYRNAERVCPECGVPAIIKGKAQHGGGWLCWAKKEGCGAKFADGDPQIEEQETGKIENQDIADVYNTVLKMATKRSLVAVVLTSTAASDLFTQDLEDLKGTEFSVGDDDKPKTEKKPGKQGKAASKPKTSKKSDKKVQNKGLTKEQKQKAARMYEYFCALANGDTIEAVKMFGAIARNYDITPKDKILKYHPSELDQIWARVRPDVEQYEKAVDSGEFDGANTKEEAHE